MNLLIKWRYSLPEYAREYNRLWTTGMRKKVRRPHLMYHLVPRLPFNISKMAVSGPPRQGLDLAVLGESHPPIFSQKLSFAFRLILIDSTTKILYNKGIDLTKGIRVAP
jgi:hypothetical protein